MTPTVFALPPEGAETVARTQIPEWELTRASTYQCRYIPPCISSPPRRSLQKTGSECSTRNALHPPRSALSAVACRTFWERQPSPPWGPRVAAQRPGTPLRWLVPDHGRALHHRSSSAVPSATAAAGVATPRRSSCPRRPRCPFRQTPWGTEGTVGLPFLQLRLSRSRRCPPKDPSGVRSPRSRRKNPRLPPRRERCRHPPCGKRRDRPGPSQLFVVVLRCRRACGFSTTPTIRSADTRSDLWVRMRCSMPGASPPRRRRPQWARAPPQLQGGVPPSCRSSVRRYWSRLPPRLRRSRHRPPSGLGSSPWARSLLRHTGRSSATFSGPPISSM